MSKTHSSDHTGHGHPHDDGEHHHASHAHGQADDGDHGHGHSHGVVDPSITTSERGIWALKWSFAGLMVTAALQVVVVIYSGSVALLADTIHNFADATTAIPLAIAFLFARRKPSTRFGFGYRLRVNRVISSTASA